MNYSFIIRKATVDDVEAIQIITREAFKKYMEDTGLKGSMEALDESLEDITRDIMSKEVFVAFIDNTPVGAIRVQILPDNTAYISRFGVSLAYHNIGIRNNFV